MAHLPREGIAIPDSWCCQTIPRPPLPAGGLPHAGGWIRHHAASSRRAFPKPSGTWKRFGCCWGYRPPESFCSFCKLPLESFGAGTDLSRKTKAAASLEDIQSHVGSRHKASSPPGPSSDTFLVAELHDQALDPTAGAQFPPAGARSHSLGGGGDPGTSPTLPWLNPPPQGR